MKSRSHRLPDPSDDWGDGSWTVDCSCGVTFDDGDEMVSCDECGVWVHTRCARFVRGEVSFACHKCKASAARHEETEVAQLLAELPTKAPDPSALPPLPLRRPHVPMEQRVHVHGTPGGDPALFAGASPVFSPQLWKCAGYIPKKFNRQYHDYRDYPFREDAPDGGGENPDSKGADVLFSLSKEIVPCSPARTMLASMISQEAVRKAEAEKAPDNVERSHGISKNERNMMRVLGANWGKRRKDESRERKKRPRDDLDRDSVDTKMRGTYSDESREPKKRPRDDPDRDSADTKTRASVVLEAKGEGSKEEGERAKIGNKPKHVFVIKASRGGSSNEVTKKRSSLATSVRVEKLKPLEGMVSEGEGSDAAKEPSVNEDVSKALHGLKQSKDENHFEGVLNGTSCAIVIENSKPMIEDLNLDGKGRTAPMVPHTIGATPPSSKLDKLEVKLHEGDGRDRLLHVTSHLPQHLQKSIRHSSRNLQENRTDMTLPYDEKKSREAQRNSEASQQTSGKVTESKASKFSIPKLFGQVVESVGSSTVPRDVVEPRYGPNYNGSTDLGCSYPSHTPTNVGNSVVDFEKALSVSAASAASPPSGPNVSGSTKSLGDEASPTVDKAFHLTKQLRVKAANERDIVTTEYTEENIQESRQTKNDYPKDSEYSGPKSSHKSRDSDVSSKHKLSDSKEHISSPPPTTLSAENTAALSSSSGTTGSKSSHVCEDSFVSSKHTMSDSKESLLSPPPKASTTDNPATLSRSSSARGLQLLRVCKDSYVSSKQPVSDSKEHIVSPPRKASATLSISTGATRSKPLHACKDSYVSSKHTLSDTATLPSSSEATGALQAPTLPSSSEATGALQAQKESAQIKLMPSAACQTNEKTSQPVFQPYKLFNSSMVMHPPTLPSSSEATRALQAQKESAQIKLMPSAACQKNEKTSQPVSQPYKLFNSSMVMHPPTSLNTTATLSDEELALLLHQELNSSPRVPRVPRVRQAAGMQLATQTATSMLKRSSSSGGKDPVSISKRKNKEDASRESSRNPIDESKRMHRITSPQPEPTSLTDGSAKKDVRNRSPDAGSAKKDVRNRSPDATTTFGEKNILVSSVEATNSGPPSFQADGQKGLFIRSSPRDVGTLSRHTLPGLIGDILSHGKHMTYEELCEAVHPHWLNLRKPNGERYAYSSHSHAVLDCLRNRNEWAHLVGRGPKTNTNKRRRKLDSDTPTVESENEEAGNKAPRESEDKELVDTHREDIPRGKRQVRKRRRLELKGQGVREAMKNQNRDLTSDDDPTALSHSSNDVAEGNFSEDGAGDGVSGSSSDDTD